MRVIKLGGSLSYSSQLQNCLDAVAQLQRDVVIVPGGGAFADQVRMAQHNWQFDDDTAHSMALLAMQQMALLFKSLKTEFVIADSLAEIGEQLLKNAIVIWSPQRRELDRAGIPASWDITSDSLAAWLAGMLKADELMLVKSALIDSHLSYRQLADHGVIDEAFCDRVKDTVFAVKIFNSQYFNEWVQVATDASIE